MDKGQILKSGFRVIPGLNSSFVIVNDSSSYSGEIRTPLGFSSIDDMLKFLSDEAEAFKGIKSNPVLPMPSTDGKTLVSPAAFSSRT